MKNLESYRIVLYCPHVTVFQLPLVWLPYLGLSAKCCLLFSHHTFTYSFSLVGCHIRIARQVSNCYTLLPSAQLLVAFTLHHFCNIVLYAIKFYSIRESGTLQTFKSRLKSHLFATCASDWQQHITLPLATTYASDLSSVPGNAHVTNWTDSLIDWLINPLTPTVKPSFVIFDILECQDVKSYKWRFKDALQLYPSGNIGRQRVKS